MLGIEVTKANAYWVKAQKAAVGAFESCVIEFVIDEKGRIIQVVEVPTETVVKAKVEFA